MFDIIFNKLRIPLFERMLDASADRQRCIADNIANVSTPGYKAKDVDFYEILRNLRSETIPGLKTHPRHMPIGGVPALDDQGDIVESRSKVLKSGENNVDIDIEMTKAAENQLLYSANTKIIHGKFAGLRKAILGRS